MASPPPQYTHTRTHTYTHSTPTARGPSELSAGLPLAQRSFLGALLPESLLHMLESYGPGVFADALAGDHDTPELIWTHAMRGGRLVPAISQHLGDFAHRLVQVGGFGGWKALFTSSDGTVLRLGRLFWQADVLTSSTSAKFFITLTTSLSAEPPRCV